jgi:hypothetical protein
MYDSKAHLDELLAAAAHHYFNNVWVADFFDEHPALSQFDSAETLQGCSDHQADRSEEVTAIFECLRRQEHINGTVTLAQGKKCLNFVHFLRFDLLFQEPALVVLDFNNVVLTCHVCFNPVEFSERVGHIATVDCHHGPVGERPLGPVE